LEAGHQINKAGLLFEKIEDEAIQAQLNKLMASKEQQEDSAPELPAPKEEITFDEFTRMDLRVGTILEAEKVAKTKKLIKLSIDLGFEQRTIVSGIAEYYQPEELPGRKVCVLANLAPRNLRGIESQGMVLLSENPDGSLHFVEALKGAANGTQIN
jgi:methionyl-tRNA synthetase